MASMTSLSAGYFLCNPKSTPNSNHSSIASTETYSYSAFDDEIPTVDYSLLFSDDPLQQSLAIEHLSQASYNFGFFYVQRFTVATLHGPSLDKFVTPAPEFANEDHPQAYLGMTYKQPLEAKGHDEIDVQSSLDKIRLPN